MRAGLALRDRQFRRHRTVYVLTPRDRGLLAALPAAFEALAAADALGIAGAAWPPRTGRLPPAERRRRAEAATRVLPAPVPEARLVGDAARLEAGLPVGLIVTPDAAALAVAHGAADGAESLLLLRALLAQAAGEPQPVPAPIAALPLLRAARQAGRGQLAAWSAGRNALEAAPVLEAVRADRDRLDGAAASFARVHLDPAQTAALRARLKGEGRATAGSRLSALALELLSAVHRGGDDPRVVLPVDLRHLLPERRVRGNFIASEAIGTLGGGPWTPSRLNELAAQQRGMGVPLLAIAASRPLRAALHRQPHEVQRERCVAVSAQTVDPMPGLGAATAESLGVAVVAPWPSPTLASALLVGRSASLSFYDDTGDFDLDRIPAELAARLP